MIPIREKVIEETHIRAELGELLAKKRSISRDPNAITLFKSGGLAVLDAVAADYIVLQVEDNGL
jgi:ornithine cyclodeaminase/alanine dehydrogenase-like protein (mu-crystallin family)